MGIVLSQLFESLFGSKKLHTFILGLDNVGKTKILYRLQTIPTIRFNLETLQYKNLSFKYGT
jgi:hypothetical protein